MKHPSLKMMDLLFGTYRHPGHEPSELGLAEPFPKTYLGPLIHPLLPERPPTAPDISLRVRPQTPVRAIEP